MTSTTTRNLAATVAVLVATLPHALEAQQSRPDKVALRFGWPVGMSARVHQDWSRVQSRSGRRDSTHVVTSYRLRVAAHPKGRLIQADSFRVLAPSTAGQAVGPEQLLARLGSFVPSYVVTREGEFVGVEGLAQMKSALDSLFAPMLAELQSAPAAARQLLTAATSEEALTASAAADWNIVAGTWAGADWEIGEVYTADAEEGIPILPGVQIKMSYAFSAAERVSCPGASDSAARRCVRLEMRSEPDSVAMRKMISELMSKVAPEVAAQLAALGQMRSENSVTLIADPRNLRPYRLELVKSIAMSSKATATEPAESATRVDRRVVEYTHTP
jgi:hypothetical protein